MSGRKVRVLSLLALPVVALLLTGFELGVRHLSPDAVRVSYSYVASGQFIFSREITDARAVADAYATATSLPTPDEQESSAVWHCGLHDSQTDTQFTIRFESHGVPILVLTRTNVCGLSWGWTLSSGGLPGDFRSDRYRHMIAFVLSVLPQVPWKN